MRTQRVVLMIMIVAIAVPALAWPRGRRVHRPSPTPPRFELVVEGGIADPMGDLADDFVGTDKGMGAATGWEIGGRLRYFLSPTTAIGPAVHVSEFGDWDDLSDGIPYSISTRVVRVGLDLQQFLAPRNEAIRPYVTLGAGLSHNTYEDWLQDSGTYTTSSQNLSFSAGGGLAMGPFEVSGLWTYNPVEDRGLPLGDGAIDHSFDWSQLSIRAGIAFGR